MSFEIRWNPQALEQVKREAGENAVLAYKEMFDRLSRTQKGKPVEEVARTLRAEWKKVAGGDITDPELTEYATTLAEGGHVQVNLRMD